MVVLLLLDAAHERRIGRVDAIGPLLEPEALEEDGQSLRSLRVLAGGVEARERGMGQDVDRTISSSSSSDATPGLARPSR